METKHMKGKNQHPGLQGNPQMHRLLLVLMVACAVAALSPAAMAATGDPTITITRYQINPTVLLPGEQGMISVVLENTANSASSTETSVNSGSTGSTTTSKTRDISVTFDSVALFGNGLEVIEGAYDHAGALGPGQSMQFTFLVRAPAKSSIYFPEVWVHIPEGSNMRYPIPVNVNSTIGLPKQAILTLNSSLPESVQPGDEIPVTLTVKNDGQLLVDEVIVRIHNVSTLVAPLGTDTYPLGRIASGEQVTIRTVLLSDKSASPGLIQVPVVLQYSDMDGAVHSQAGSINLMMKGKGELGFVSVDTNPQQLTENTPFDLTVRIENTGTGEVKAVSARIDLESEGTKEAFIGKIKPGNDAPAMFYLEGLKTGTYPYSITITYSDDLGEHTVSRGLSVRVPPADTSGTVLMGILGIGILGFVAYRFWYVPRKNGNGAFPWVKKN
jgi:hypothetical protein